MTVPLGRDVAAVFPGPVGRATGTEVHEELGRGCHAGNGQNPVGLGSQVGVRMSKPRDNVDHAVGCLGERGHEQFVQPRNNRYSSHRTLGMMLCLRMPTNITALLLPPCLPELNPIENLRHSMRSHDLSNRAYEGYDHLLLACCDARCALTPEIIRSVCRCGHGTHEERG